MLCTKRRLASGVTMQADTARRATETFVRSALPLSYFRRVVLVDIGNAAKHCSLLTSWYHRFGFMHTKFVF